MKNAKWTLVAVLLLVCAAAGYHIGRARADGIPAKNTLSYSGVLEKDGAPVSGKHKIQVALWDDALATDVSHQKCATVVDQATVADDGWFSLSLDAPCTAAVHATSQLWVEVALDTVSLGRAPVSAVPFAVEADRASNSAGNLEARLQALENKPAAGVPTGTIVAFFGTTIPDGWLACNGQSIDKGTTPRYKDLVDLLRAVGAAFQGTTATVALVPDLRGMFLRGQDAGRGKNPDPGADTIGLEQSDAFQAHTHVDSGHTHQDVFSSFDSAGSIAKISNTAASATGGTLALYTQKQVGYSATAQLGEAALSTGGDPRFKSETRPSNTTVTYIIKL